jgi:hypothetical protein
MVPGKTLEPLKSSMFVMKTKRGRNFRYTLFDVFFKQFGTDDPIPLEEIHDDYENEILKK